MALEFELVLPCYNESSSLRALLDKVSAAAIKYSLRPDEFQVVLVENGSRDDSLIRLNQIKESELGKWFRVVPLAANQGYGHGLWQGLQSTTAEIVGWSHADLQCDPADAIRAFFLLKNADSDKTLVKGSRFGRNWKDRIVSGVFAICAKLILGFNISEINAQPKIFHRSLLTSIPYPPKDFAFDLYVLYRAQKNSYKILTVEVEFPPRIYGVSNWAANFLSRYKTILKMIMYMRRLSVKEGRLR